MPPALPRVSRTTTPKSACPPLRTLWPSCRSFRRSFFALSNSKRGNCSLSELQCWAETADHKPDRQSSEEMGEENSLNLRKTHGAGRADGRVPLAPSARQMPKGRGAQGGVTFLGYVQVTWACPRPCRRRKSSAARTAETAPRPPGGSLSGCLFPLNITQNTGATLYTSRNSQLAPKQ